MTDFLHTGAFPCSSWGFDFPLPPGSSSIRFFFLLHCHYEVVVASPPFYLQYRSFPFFLEMSFPGLLLGIRASPLPFKRRRENLFFLSFSSACCLLRNRPHPFFPNDTGGGFPFFPRFDLVLLAKFLISLPKDFFSFFTTQSLSLAAEEKPPPPLFSLPRRVFLPTEEEVMVPTVELFLSCAILPPFREGESIRIVFFSPFFPTNVHHPPFPGGFFYRQRFPFIRSLSSFSTFI